MEGDRPMISFGPAESVRYDTEDNHVRIGSGASPLGPIRVRLASPAEFGLMARIAGLRLRDR